MDNKGSADWKIKVQEIINTCQSEFKRTTKIGKQMISASKTNSDLHDAYRELGMLAVKEIRKGSLQWDNTEVKTILQNIENCEQNLENLEVDVNKARFSSQNGEK